MSNLTIYPVELEATIKLAKSRRSRLNDDIISQIEGLVGDEPLKTATEYPAEIRALLAIRGELERVMSNYINALHDLQKFAPNKEVEA